MNPMHDKMASQLFLNPSVLSLKSLAYRGKEFLAQTRRERRAYLN